MVPSFTLSSEQPFKRLKPQIAIPCVEGSTNTEKKIIASVTWKIYFLASILKQAQLGL